MSAAELKRFAASLPEASEGQHGGRVAFRVRNKLFVVFQPGDDDVLVQVSPDERQALLTDNPAGFEEITNTRGVVSEWITVHLSAAETQQVRELLEDGWRRFAPKRAIVSYERDGGRPSPS